MAYAGHNVLALLLVTTVVWLMEDRAAEAFDNSKLSGWKLQLPVSCSGGAAAAASRAGTTCRQEGDIAAITPIGSFDLWPYFSESATGAKVMRANAADGEGGLTTSGSDYARSELRHLQQWTLTKVGYAKLAVTMSVDVLPTATGGGNTPSWLFPSPPLPRPGAIAIGQIKGTVDSELALKFELEPGIVYLTAFTTSTSNQYRLLQEAGSNARTAIPLGDKFQYTIEVDSSNVRAKVVHRGRTYSASLAISSIKQDFSSANPVCFKAGCYVQVHEGASRSGYGYGQVSLYSISVST